MNIKFYKETSGKKYNLKKDRYYQKFFKENNKNYK